MLVVSPRFAGAGEREAVIFAVEADEKSGVVSIDPILMMREGVVSPVPDPCAWSDPELLSFERQYFKPETRYRFLFGGLEAGSVVVLPPKPMLNPVKLESSVQLGDFQMGLATDSTRLGRLKRTRTRRAPNETDKAAARKLATSLFLEKGVPKSALERMKVDSLTLTDLDGDGRAELVGSVFIERADHFGLEHSLFFVARAKAVHWIPVHSWFQSPTSETEAEIIRFVDSLDLDGDGVDEFITMRLFYENYRYQVYRIRRGKWQKIFETATFGCL
jgi:hypothetical protein